MPVTSCRVPMSRNVASSVESSGSTTTRPPGSSARNSGSSVDRCAVSTTVSPRSSSARAVCDPMEPRPPVTSINGSTRQLAGRCRGSSAPQTGPVEQALAPGTTIVGVRLRPEAASSVLGMPTPALRDLAVDADELWGDRAHALQELVGSASSDRQAASHLERALAERLAGAPAPDPVVAQAVLSLVSGRRAEVAALASSLCISERQLRRRFESATGLTPTTLHRILRFQRFLALAWIRAQPSTQVAQLAVEAGYANQAHLSREAARLEGRSPRNFLSESELRCGCGHDHSASYAPLLRHRVKRAQDVDLDACRNGNGLRLGIAHEPSAAAPTPDALSWVGGRLDRHRGKYCEHDRQPSGCSHQLCEPEHSHRDRGHDQQSCNPPNSLVRDAHGVVAMTGPRLSVRPL
jgi:AraC-like DNA-binding protein